MLVSVAADRDHTMALWPAARKGVFRIGRKEVPLQAQGKVKEEERREEKRLN